MKTQHLSAIILFVFFFLSCNNDDDTMENPSDFQEECDELENLGRIALVPTSKSFIPYPDTVSKIIFSDATGNEFTAKVSSFTITFNPSGTTSFQPCPLDTNIFLQYNWEAENKHYAIEIEELNISAWVTVRATPWLEMPTERIFTDGANIVLFTPIGSSSPNAQIYALVDPRNHPLRQDEENEIMEEVTIHGMTFENVYFNVPGNETQFRIYYNTEVGFVGFEREMDDLSIRFDRME